MGRCIAILAPILAACAPIVKLPPDDAASTPAWRTSLWQPRLISSARFESHGAFDPWTRRLYLVRSDANFDGWRIFESECADGEWREPVSPSFTGDSEDADPFVTPDGKSLWFISTRSANGIANPKLDIWRVDRAHPRAPWGKPVRLDAPLNSDGKEWFPRPAIDGWLYFGSDRAGGYGRTDLYRARLRRGGWRVENLGAGVNGPGDEFEAEVSPDGSRLLLMADGDLYVAPRRDNGWGARRKLGPEINSDGLEVGGAFASDGKSFMFARDRGEGTLSGEFVVAREASASPWPEKCG